MVSPDEPAAPAPALSVESRTAFGELAALVVGEEPLGRILYRVADLARACLAGAPDVSVTVIDASHRAATVGFTGPLASVLDERQYEDGFGPCLDAAHSGEVIRIDDTAAENPYRAFTRIAARQGVRSMLSVGMPMPQRLVGGLNVYVSDAAPLGADAVEVLQVFGRYASIALANHSLYASSLSLNSHLQVSLRSRATIEQAKGVLMGRTGCSAEEAFAMLTERSQAANRKLRDIAVEVVGSVRAS